MGSFKRSVMLLALGGLACASGPPKLVGRPIRSEVAIFVKVSDEAARSDDMGAIASMVETLSTQLTEAGVRNQVYAAADDDPPAPRIDILVEKWAAPARDSRGIGYVFGIAGQLATAGEYSVVCKIYTQDKGQPPALVRRYAGPVIGIDEGASASQGESVGSSIRRAALAEGHPTPSSGR
jgi:hypothetical protein